jgi:hypothetical protein
MPNSSSNNNKKSTRITRDDSDDDDNKIPSNCSDVKFLAMQYSISCINTTEFMVILLILIIFEVFTAVTMKNGVFWVVTPCGSCKNQLEH